MTKLSRTQRDGAAGTYNGKAISAYSVRISRPPKLGVCEPSALRGPHVPMAIPNTLFMFTRDIVISVRSGKETYVLEEMGETYQV